MDKKSTVKKNGTSFNIFVVITAQLELLIIYSIIIIILLNIIIIMVVFLLSIFTIIFRFSKKKKQG